jgi:hypothetical protein
MRTLVAFPKDLMLAATAAHHSCASCGASLGEGRYCPQCGEAVVHQGDLSFGHLTHDFVHEFTHLDGKIWRTLKALLLTPGKLTKEYWEGRRGLWVRPLRLYLVISALQLLLAPTSSGPLGIRVWVYAGLNGEPAYAIGAKPVNNRPAELIKEDLSHRIQTVYLWIRYLSLGVFAAASYLVYRKQQAFYGAHVIFGLHFYSFEYVINSLTARIPAEATASLTTIAGGIYLFLALRRLFGQSVAKTVWRTFVLFTAVAVTETAMVVGSLLLVLRLHPH